MSRELILNGSIFKVYGHYVIPSVISMAGASAYVLADTFFIANALGEAGLSALNIALPAYYLMSATGLLIGIGGSTCFAVATGGNRFRRGREFFGASLAAAGLATLLFTLAGLFFTPAIVRLLGGTPETMAPASSYLRTMLLLSGIFIFNHVLLAFARNDGAPRLAMTAMLLSTGCNIVLDYLLMYPIQWGMFGAALASGLAAALSLAMLSARFLRRRRRFRFSFRRVNRSDLLHLLPPGAAGFVTEMSSGLVIWLFNLFILRLAGNTGIAAYSIIANLSLIGVAIFTGVGQGIQPIISTSYGAGRTNRIRHTILMAAGASFGIGVLLFLSGVLFSGPIIALFNRDDSAELAAVTAVGIRKYFSAFLFLGLNIVGCAAAAAMTYSRTALAGSLLRGGLFPTIALFLFTPFWGLAGVWFAVPAAEFFTFLFLLAMLFFYRKPRISACT